MDGPELSERERMILAGIEGDLRSDERLDRRLRTLRRGFGPWSGAWSRAGTWTALLVLGCACLFVRAVATGAPALLWLFSGVWVATAVRLLWLGCAWGRRRAKAWAGTRARGGGS
ncbi:DUF3040 domain-containing protein [Streptomyces lavendulae]|uniref:DUF3040 domain-containing protein n=1 Tax=Streptomyces lavendulae TaxID=1914 RepID=UPI0024A41811|nr:DUF3040 domain-containing protein [Streptomyces lavendulae]GLX20819.1 hypothetical protein Slala01_44630 [Streptomyces lavendulae subsp. lavendulae]GLX28018.1 hypothetical protein Slala02_38380 [Streptomyces lavendulae subsp. lavendulae]